MDKKELAELCRQRGPESLMAFYEWSQVQEGFKLPPHLMAHVLGLTDERIDKFMVQIGPGSGKALALDTPVLTTRGWIPVSECRVGDFVIRPDGSTSPILAVWPQSSAQLWSVKFDDGRTVVVNDEHLWSVHNKKFTQSGSRDYWRVRSTKELRGYINTDPTRTSVKWYVPLCQEITVPGAVDLPLPPYLLGALIGDGHFGDNGYPVFTCFDQDTVDHLRALNVNLSEYKRGSYGVRGVCSDIRNLGLAGSRSWDKFIPSIYQNAPIPDRYEFLQGLFDADGYVGRKTVSLTTVSPILAQDVARMVRSLGGCAYVTTKEAKYTKNGGDPVICRTAYTVWVRHRHPSRLFRLPRKKEKALPTQYSDNLKLGIDSITPAYEGESICISIGHPDGLFLCGDYIVTHNSQLLSVVYPAWELGGNPETTIVGVSGAEGLAAGFMDAAARIIENTEAFRMSFPDVRPDKATGWSTGRGYYVTGRRPTVPDASYWAGGLSSKELTGKHGTLIILDDLHDDQNSSTEAQCQQVVNRYATQLVGRADAQGARFILAGRRWNEKDLYGHLQNNGDWVCLTLPAERPGSTDLWVDITVPEGIECVFTDGMVHTSDGDIYVARDTIPAPWKITEHKLPGQEAPVRIRHIRWKYGEDYMKQGFFWPDPNHPACQKKGPGNEPKRKDFQSVKRLSPTKAEAVYQCNPGARQGIVFLDSDFERRFRVPQNLAAGVHDPEVKAFLAQGSMVIQSWDTAFSASSTSDYTVCTTALLVECDQYHNGEDPALLGPCDAHYDALLLDVYRERVAYGDLTRKVREMHQKWHPSVIVVEKKAYGVTIVETLTNAGLPIIPVSPNSLESKRARAVEGVGAGSVQGWCRQGRCAFPDLLPDATEVPWFSAFKREMKDFTGEPGNTDDQVDSYVHLVRWAIQNGGSFAKIGDGSWDTDSAIDSKMGHDGSGTLAAALGIDLQAPEMRICASCRYFQDNRCVSNMHPMPTLSISTCDDHIYHGENTPASFSFQQW